MLHADEDAQANAFNGRWVATWTASADRNIYPTAPKSFPAATTVRQIVHASVGGNQLRLRLSNEFGTAPVTVGPVHVALSAGGAKTLPNSDRTVTFGGKTIATLYAGAPLISDPIDLPIAPLSDVAISLFLPNATLLGTIHNYAAQTAYVSSGDNTAAPDQPSPTPYTSRFFVSGLLVKAQNQPRTVVAFGDSITDGQNSTTDANKRWPDVLSRRLNGNGPWGAFAVLNQGIAGNRVLADLAGVSALARYDRDVLSLPGVQWVVLLEGINDIGFPGGSLAPNANSVSADEIIRGYKQLIARSREHGIKVMGGTLTPFKGSEVPYPAYWSSQKETTRQAVNNWIRTSGAFDAVVDFDAALRDPANPQSLLPAFDSGDHLHPNDAGYAAMANAISLPVLRAVGP
ncbi:SGNH/GDSL hydrolase family protein [Ralstonia soli]|uniref:SGNH/GDSL hydrolase family protein n=1 Tax=Ralstonia soli TaxID=2953896 RepID=A0ABT1AK12_9RALS|nr:SGNH/GDSL hydrolase family protein [Ralstonia soli]MCO5398735.1 SGNH/GDSL hydrolase family protein [Ralstonia soli]